MSDRDQELFEAELQRLSPAKLPDRFTECLIEARTELAPQPAVAKVRRPPMLLWREWLLQLTRGHAAAYSVAALFVLIVTSAILLSGSPHPVSSGSHVAPEPHAVRADDVEIDRQLVEAFDAVATMPDGEPVRVLCQQWMDEVVLRDNKHGVAIQQRTPRFEVIPVRFETF